MAKLIYSTQTTFLFYNLVCPNATLEILWWFRVQCLVLQASTEGGKGSIPDLELRMLKPCSAAKNAQVNK